MFGLTSNKIEHKHVEHKTIRTHERANDWPPWKHVNLQCDAANVTTYRLDVYGTNGLEQDRCTTAIRCIQVDAKFQQMAKHAAQVSNGIYRIGNHRTWHMKLPVDDTRNWDSDHCSLEEIKTGHARTDSHFMYVAKHCCSFMMCHTMR